jgi:hypothetical protein
MGTSCEILSRVWQNLCIAVSILTWYCSTHHIVYSANCISEIGQKTAPSLSTLEWWSFMCVEEHINIYGCMEIRLYVMEFILFKFRLMRLIFSSWMMMRLHVLCNLAWNSIKEKARTKFCPMDPATSDTKPTHQDHQRGSLCIGNAARVLLFIYLNFNRLVCWLNPVGNIFCSPPYPPIPSIQWAKDIWWESDCNKQQKSF